MADGRFDESQGSAETKPGEARRPGPATRDLIHADGQATSAALAERYSFLGDEDIPHGRHISRDFFDPEMNTLWAAQTLGDYREARSRRIHPTRDKYLND